MYPISKAILNNAGFDHQKVHIGVLLSGKVTKVAKEERVNVIFSVDFGNQFDQIFWKGSNMLE